jgi:hypothetical protein
MSTPTSVGVQLPSGWIELDPREPNLVEELERALEIPAEHRETVLSLLAPLAAELGRTAAAADIVLVGLFAQAVPIDGADQPLVLAGHVVLAISPQVGNLDEVREVLNRNGGDVAPVDLPAGAAVLSTGETRISDPSWEESVPARTRRYFVPIPDTDRVAALSFLTPNVELADQFDEVFDAIARTLEFGYEDSPESVASAP